MSVGCLVVGRSRCRLRLLSSLISVGFGLSSFWKGTLDRLFLFMSASWPSRIPPSSESCVINTYYFTPYLLRYLPLELS